MIVIYLSLNAQITTNSWEWFFLVIFVYIGLYIFLIGFLSNFLGLFILLEAQVIVFLLLTQLENNSVINIETIARWCLLNIVSSLFLMISFGLLYEYYGTINLVDLLILDIDASYGNKLAFSLFYSSFLFKIGIPPFHFWLPDVYETSNLQLVTILIAPIKLFYIIVLQIFILTNSEISYVFQVIGFISMTIGLLITLNQFVIKRFLAWTGIFYFGAFLILMSNINLENIFYLKIYINLYLVSSLIFVLINQINIYRLSDFIFVFGDNSLAGLFFLALLIIIIGLPVMAGFFSKLVFYYSLISSNISYIVVLILLTFTSFAGFYYLNTYIYSLSFKYLLQNNNLLEKLNCKINVLIYLIILLIFFIMFYPYQMSYLFLYLI